jgi:hypothetical protein
MTRQRRKAPPDQVWKAFAGRHAGNPFLNEDPLYALTEPVIDALVNDVPAVLTGDLEWFERDLARTAYHGFCFRRVIGGTGFVPPEPVKLMFDRRPKRGDQPGFEERLRKRPGLIFEHYAEEMLRPIEESFGRLAPFLRVHWANDQKTDGAIAGLNELLAEMWQRGGRANRVDIEMLRKQWRREKQLAHARPEAYLGWLLTNSQFATELRAMRKTWGNAVERRGSFPTAPRDPVDEAYFVFGNTAPPTLDSAWHDFYRQWGLERMLTWDLPLPMISRTGCVFPEDFRHLTGAGITLFIPWYMLRGGELDLRDLAQRLKVEKAPLHLREWIRKESTRANAETGDLTYQRLHWIYRCYELVLLRRYGTACRNHIEKVDRALGKVMGRGEDWVKKLRLRLHRELQHL